MAPTWQIPTPELLDFDGSIGYFSSMKQPRASIKVEVMPGMFSSERTVLFSNGSVTYQLVLDEAQLFGGSSLPIEILDETDEGYLISLPSDTFTSGSTVRVPRNLVELH